MALTVLCSLALMMQLMSTVLHFVAMVTPAWVQLGVSVPPVVTVAGDGGNGSSSWFPVAGGGGGHPTFVRVRLGLWGWCQQFQDVTPNCQTPEFLYGVGVLAVVALVTVPLSLVLLIFAGCQQPCKKRRLCSLLSLLASTVSGFVLLVIVAVYAILTRREIARMMSLIGDDPELSYLGWSFGADAVASLLSLLAALFIGIHLRHNPKASSPQFQLVASTSK